MTPQNRVRAFRSMDTAFPYHVIERGGPIAALPRSPQKLGVSYEFKGKRHTLNDLLADAAKGPCKVAVAYRNTTAPSGMDAGFQHALTVAAQSHAPGLHQPMPSGAGHDAQILSQILPSAMLFVPSIGGISHHYSENTRDEDIVLGCQVFADAAAAILAKG